MNDDTYLFIGDHPETIDSGRRVSRGDELASSDTEGPVAQRLIASGQLVETRRATAKERAALEQQDNQQGDPEGDADQGDEESSPPDDQETN